jgi:hypothetical protein
MQTKLRNAGGRFFVEAWLSLQARQLEFRKGYEVGRMLGGMIAHPERSQLLISLRPASFRHCRLLLPTDTPVVCRFGRNGLVAFYNR